MPDFNATLLAIVVMTVATYLTRIAGYLLGSRITPDSIAGRVLAVLPGAALAGVLALSMINLAFVEVFSVAVAVLVFVWSGRTLVGIMTGLFIAVLSAHLLG
ncbi:MAG: AzlD domain-containing protein [Woeseia sp.]|nr:AzlD domain-containing protein [Woeseia sp.]MBT8095781.1 AzlD domain-containing protein [Woeseia sp.]NNE61769.1 AzlD domain-containing protein [Woeseia sp.]NNL54182.1 AzlD domain-containing protein [Woeseia sp.]